MQICSKKKLLQKCVVHTVYSPKLLPQLANIFTRINPSYLWHFATLRWILHIELRFQLVLDLSNYDFSWPCRIMEDAAGILAVMVRTQASSHWTVGASWRGFAICWVLQVFKLHHQADHCIAGLSLYAAICLHNFPWIIHLWLEI